MSKLKSMKNFEKEVLKTEEQLNVLGGKGGPADSFSTDAQHRGTMNGWNCTDTQVKMSTDKNGVWLYGVWQTVCEEEYNFGDPCPNTGYPNGRATVS